MRVVNLLSFKHKHHEDDNKFQFERVGHMSTQTYLTKKGIWLKFTSEKNILISLRLLFFINLSTSSAFFRSS